MTGPFLTPDTPEELGNGFMFRAPEEPSAGSRASAAAVREFFVSLTQSGFSAEESLELVKVVIRTAAEQSQNGDTE